METCVSIEKDAKHEDESVLSYETCSSKPQKENQGEEIPLNWELCPTEILLMIFERMDVSALVMSMFVNTKWRTLVEHVVEHRNLWPEFIKAEILTSREQLKQKSKDLLDWQQLYYNHVQWNNLNRAQLEIQEVNGVKNVNRISVYRDNLIVVTSENVTYYQIDNFTIKKSLDIQCQDYFENDYMIAIIVKASNDRYPSIEFYIKESKDDANMDRSRSNMYHIQWVALYKIENNFCYILNYRNCLSIYTIRHPDFKEVFVIRHYDNPLYTRALHVFNGEVFLLLQSGAVIWADKPARRFKKIPHDLSLTRFQSPSVSCEMFYKFGFVFTVGVDSNETFRFDRHILNDTIFVFRCPKLSCVLQHANILFLGYKHGTVEIYNPRDVTKTESLLSFNLQDLKPNVEDLEVVSIDVCEDVGYQHMFVSTRSKIFHLAIKHPNCHEYMWKKYTNTISVL